MRSIHFIFVGHRIVDATPANFASVRQAGRDSKGRQPPEAGDRGIPDPHSQRPAALCGKGNCPAGAFSGESTVTEDFSGENSIRM